MAPGFGGPDEDKNTSLKAFPFFGSQTSLIQDLNQLLIDIRSKAGSGEYDAIINDKPVLFLSDPASKLSGDKEIEILGARAALIHNAIKGAKDLWSAISTELSSPDDGPSEELAFGGIRNMTNPRTSQINSGKAICL